MKRDERLIVAPRPKDFALARRQYLGGTDVAAVIGVSERKTRFQVWCEKVGALTDSAMSEEAEAGVFMEPFVLRRFAERFGVRLDRAALTYRLRSAPHIGVNPDALDALQTRRAREGDGLGRSGMRAENLAGPTVTRLRKLHLERVRAARAMDRDALPAAKVEKALTGKCALDEE